MMKITAPLSKEPDQNPIITRKMADNNYTGKRLLSEILADMEKPVAQDFLSFKPTFSKGQRSGDVAFIAWPALCRLLNLHCAGFWEWKVRIAYAGDRTVVEGSLTIHGSDGSLTREATGNELSEVDGYGDPSSNAEAMALRRCCAKFGLGLDLWVKPKNGSKTKGQTVGKGELSPEEWRAKFANK